MHVDMLRSCLKQFALLLSYNTDMEKKMFNSLELQFRFPDVLANDMEAIGEQLNELARRCIPAVSS